MTSYVRSGKVDWTGDNPFIYLKTDPEDAEWSTLSLFFRINASDYGPGHAMVVVEDPSGVDEANDLARVCLTDNLPLAGWLVDEFVSHMGVFRGVAGLKSLTVVEGTRFERSASGSTHYTEYGSTGSNDLEIVMTWESLQPSFAVDVPPDSSATGRHEMFSAFRIAERAHVTVNGRRLAGEPVLRDFFNGRSKSAALAFSETWVREK